MIRWMVCGATAIAVAMVSLPAEALGHRSSPSKLSEAELLRAETATLGRAHAAEHAAQRRLARKARRQRAESSGARLRERAIGRPQERRRTHNRRGRPAARRVLAQGPASEVGRWLPGATFPGVAINAALLPTGKILYYPGRVYGFSGTERAYVWDPTRPLVSGSNPRLVMPPTPSGWTIFCSGTSFLPNGHALVTGGQIEPSSEKGAPIVMTFDPFTESWTRRADMADGRWYPSQVLLPSGLTAILSGRTVTAAPNRRIEVYDSSTATTSVVATRGTTGAPPGGGDYPHLTTMPSGRTLVAGPGTGDSWLFSVSGSSFSWSDVPNLPTKRDFASGIPLPGSPFGSTKVMLIAGRNVSGAALSSTLVFDEANAAAGWKPGPTLKVGRAHHNTVLLPDGSMTAVGGGFGSRNGDLHASDATHKQVELYDPTTSTWRLGPSQAHQRAYHSTALLLPDGRVLSAGDDGPGAGGGNMSDVFEIYEPPYLHKTTPSGDPVPRPTISGAPASIDYGQAFTVDSADANVTRGVLVAPGAATHAVDMNQRHVELALTKRTDGRGYDLAAPGRAALAPPGYYMLFLLNDQGVPSTARFIRLGAGATPPPPPPTAPGAPSIGAPTAGDQSATVRWSAPSSDGGAAITGYRVRTFSGTVQVGSPADVAGTATSTVIAGLTNGTQYTFDVAAVNSVGAGAFSDRSTSVTPTAGSTTPGITLHGSSFAANATATTLTLPAPSGARAGDVEVMAIAARGAPRFTAPSGWTLARGDTNGNVMTQSVFTHVVGDSEPASYTWTLSSSQSAAGGIIAYGGVRTVTPVDAAGGQANASSTSVTAPSIVTSSPGTQLVGFFGIGAATTFTAPTGMVERGDVASAGIYKVTLEGADASRSAAGATGQAVARAVNGAANVGQLVALAP